MEKKVNERLIKEIVIESNNLLEFVQWNDQKEDIEKMRIQLSILMTKCETLKEKLG
ncbi:MAG TPA: hypothetical protein VFH18_08335 [Erysipelotrichaceae bacterium]|nr:hypothetical protein [Erysipelotrichaceae bacterium]